MGKVFLSHTTFNPHPGQYSFENWNRAIAINEPHHQKIIKNLIKGNFYVFMNVLLDFEYSKEVDIYVPKKERRYGAKKR